MKEETTQEDEEEEEEAAAAKQLTNDLSSSSHSRRHPLISLLLQPLHVLADLTFRPTSPHHHRRRNLSVRPQPGLLSLLLPRRRRLLLEGRPQTPAFSSPVLRWPLLSPMALEASVGPPHRRPPRRRIPPPPILGGRRGHRGGVFGGGGDDRRPPRGGRAGVFDGGESGYGGCECDNRCLYCEEQVRELAGDLQSLCGFCTSAGALIGYSSSGFVVHHLGPQKYSKIKSQILEMMRNGALGLLAIPPASILVLGFFLFESRVTTVPNLSSEQKVLVRVGGAVGDMWRTMKCPQIWKPSLFIFLSLALSVTTHEGHFYWYTDPKAGLGFSKEFVGILYSIGAIASMLGVVIYHKFLKGYPFRNLLFCAQLLYSLSGMMDLVWVLRWNLAFRIPDSFFAVLEESVLRSIRQIRWIPMMVLSTKLCPPGIEGTFFALLMCIDSLGTLFSKWGGGFLIHQLHVTRTNFTNLWLAVLIRNCLRFVTLALIFLVPNVNQSDVVVPPPDVLEGKSSSKNDADEESRLVPLSEKIDI